METSFRKHELCLFRKVQIGKSLQNLETAWGEDIPPIQCLVVNQKTELPGAGVGWFVWDVGNFADLPPLQQQRIVERAFLHVFAYSRWIDVLAAFGLDPVSDDYGKLSHAASHWKPTVETEHHRALKEFVAGHPEVAGLPKAAAPGVLEHLLPSADRIDVYFSHHGHRTAVEVKSHISGEPDIFRGFFQCVKYRAVLKAQIAAEGGEEAAEAVLVLGGMLPHSLIGLKNALGVHVAENVQPD